MTEKIRCEGGEALPFLDAARLLESALEALGYPLDDKKPLGDPKSDKALENLRHIRDVLKQQASGQN